MPFYLDYVAAGGKYMQMPAAPTPFGVVASAQNFKLTISVRCVGNNPIVLGSTVDDSSVTFPSATQIQLKGSSGAIALYTITSNLVDFREIEFSRTDGANVVLKINGATIDTKPLSTGLIFNRLAANNLGVSAVSFQLKYIKLEKDGALAYNWENTTGTGTQMPDTVGARPFNQIGTWPADNSEWVSYSAGGTAPTGTVTIGTITPNSTGASAPFTYSAADQTGFEYQLNETGTIYPISASPAMPTGLTPSTAYTIRVRAVNASGVGAWSSSAPFTTSGVAVSFVGGPIPDQVATVGVFFSLNVAAYFTGTLTPLAYDFSFGSVTGTGLSLNASTGMLEGTPTSTGDLDLQFRATDTGTNTAVSNLISLLINPASDVTPPTFTVAPAVTSITQTGGTATATIDETGSIFYVVVPQAQATPSVAQVIAGQNASGTAPIDSGSAVGTTTLSDAFTGLTAGTAYKACFVARDDEPTPNVQAAVTVVNFNAAAAPVGTITITDVANNIDTPWISSAVDIATIMPLSLGSVVVNKTGLSTTAGATLVITDAAIVTGTEYIIIIKIGTAYGWYRAVAT